MSTGPHFEDDVFISYGHIDNQLVEDDGKGWVDKLHEGLERRLGELLGYQPNVWRDPRMPGNVYFADELEDRIRKTRVLVSVLSPGYLQSSWCMGELREFCRLAELNGGLKVGGLLRIFKVVKTYIPRERHPHEFHGQLGYEFFELDRASGRPVEFGQGHDRRYRDRLNRLAWDIKQTLERIKPAEAAPPAHSSPLPPGQDDPAGAADDLRKGHDGINQPNLRSPETRERYKSPKQYLEYRIRESYQFFRGFAKEADDPTDDGAGLSESLREKYSEVIKYYLQIYFLLCRRQRLTPTAEIVKISEDFPDVAGYGAPHVLASTTPSEIYTNIPGSRITVGVSQMFRIADLLTRPESVRARKFYSSITKVNKLRRTLKEGKSFALGDLGKLRPVTSKSGEYQKFWLPAIPDLRLPTAQPLCFIPYELNLTQQLRQFRSDFESTLVSNSDTIRNSQIHGRLRIYPPGIGVISLGLSLEFKQEIHIELVAQIAHDIEELLFVDPDGSKQPYSDLMLDIINRVIDNLFVNEGYSFEERRWQPPTTTYSFPEGHGLVPEQKVNELAYLMSLAPANGEDLQHLQDRIRRAFRTPHWKNEHVLAVAGDEVALCFVGDHPGRMSGPRRDKFLLWLAETHELISAAAYAQQAFAEEVNKIFNQRLLNDSWLPRGNGNFAYLKSLLETMRQVLRAISSLDEPRGHLHKQGSGFLKEFAKDVWTYSNPVDRHALAGGLAYISEWLNDAQGQKPLKEVEALSEVLEDIRLIGLPFPPKVPATSKAGMPPEQEQLEQRLLDQLTELEVILTRFEPQEHLEADSRRRIMQKLRMQLGL